jgi:serine phosphatase RsbU (regulator of sigma subunit)
VNETNPAAPPVSGSVGLGRHLAKKASPMPPPAVSCLRKPKQNKQLNRITYKTLYAVPDASPGCLPQGEVIVLSGTQGSSSRTVPRALQVLQSPDIASMRPMHLTETSGDRLSHGLRSAWVAILVLSPLAFLAATLLENKLPHEAKFTSIGREKAIEIATGFARTLDPDSQNWTPGTTVQRSSTTASLFRYAHPRSLERIFAPATIDVILSDEKVHRFVKVSLAPDGRVLGFVSTKPSVKDTPLEEPAARIIAEEFLRRRLGPDNPFRLENPTVHAQDKQAWDRDFVWEASAPELPQAKVRFHVDVAGNRVVSQSYALNLDPALQAKVSPGRTREIVLGVATALYFLLLGGYAIFRYVQRSIEREISHRRTLLVVAMFAISGVIALGLNGTDAGATINGEPAAGTKLILILALGLGIPGVLFGVAYGAGEGDLREAFPGKLSSVDAFLCGKWFSANCARSILSGVAFAGWLLLIQNALLAVIHGAPVGDAADIVRTALQRSPLTATVADVFTDITLVAAFGMMLPLTLLRSRIRKTWLVYTLLFPFSVLVGMSVAPGGHSWQNNLVIDTVYGVAIFAPFVFGDLLAAVSCLTALEFVHVLIRKSAISDQWHSIAYGHVLPAGIIFLLAELYFAWRGRVYSEAEVRPLYARHLIERLALTAEIGAARLAQVRLLPDAPPRIAGLSIAGSCIPAREVGGDFFDYHVLDDHRLGVFLAEGGSRELGSAMAIALAKGYLMYTARLDLTPVEILRRLRTTLGSVLRGEDAPMTVLYAVVDGRTGSLRYARAGASPRLVINGTPLAEEIVGDRVDGIEIRHGAATLAPNDTLFFYTDGWAGQIAENTRRGPHEFLRNLARQFPEGGADALHKAALDAAIRRRRNAPPDDVTAVVVRLEEIVEAAEAVGGIA